MTSRIQENIYKLIESTDLGSGANRIFIVGKGPSLDELENFRMPGGLVININDSEKIIQGQLGLFSANWVRHSLKERGFRCTHYLAGKPLPQGVSHDLLPAVPLEYDDEDLNSFRLGLDEFYDESFVLINALKVARQLALRLNRQLEVYLLGFDFSTAMGEISKSAGADFAKNNDVDRNLVVHSHEAGYLQFLNYFNEHPSIKLIHVGTKEYSKLSPSQFRSKFEPVVVHRPPAETPDTSNRTLIVAEFTNNHLGDVDRLVEMVERAKEAGADLIKIQKRDVDGFYTKEKLESFYWSPFGKTLGDYRRGVELNEEKLGILNDKCKAMEIGWFCSVLDFPSFEEIMKFSPGLIKIPSTISNHRDFHAQVARNYRGPLVVSTGYTEQAYEDYVLSTFRNNERIYLLHCVSSYPTVLSDCNIAVVQHYTELAKNNPKIVPGYSSHDIGSMASVLAVASGARMIEKHVKLGDVEWVHFDKVALDLKTNTFRDFVADIRAAEIVLGSSQKRVLASEHHKYEVKDHAK